MNKKLSIIIALQALLLFLFWVLIFYGKDEYRGSQNSKDAKIDKPKSCYPKSGS